MPTSFDPAEELVSQRSLCAGGRSRIETRNACRKCCRRLSLLRLKPFFHLTRSEVLDQAAKLLHFGFEQILNGLCALAVAWGR